MQNKKSTFGSSIEAIVYPLLLLVMMWAMWLVQLELGGSSSAFGVKGQDWTSWKGIFLMPLLHDPHHIDHIAGNSIPTLVLLGSVIYYYRFVALKLLVTSWLGVGFLIILFGKPGAFHIGMSGVDYALFAFVAASGLLRNYRPLQGLSLFVLFIYGSFLWGIFPLVPEMSWEGHLGGLLIGLTFAIYYRKEGPQRPKLRYEIEKELGIDPPDLEGMWIRRQEEIERQRLEREMLENQNFDTDNQQQIIYHFKPKDDENKL